MCGGAVTVRSGWDGNQHLPIQSHGFVVELENGGLSSMGRRKDPA